MIPVTRSLIDLLWREHPKAPTRGARGPRARLSTGDAVTQAIQLADAGGLEAVTVRALGEALDISPMSVYTHVNDRDDLRVLMVDQAHADMPTAAPSGPWAVRVRHVATQNLDLVTEHPWTLDVTDQRTALGPGTIAKYDRELHAFDDTGLAPRDRDAALTFVLDFTRAAARSLLTPSAVEGFGADWARTAERLHLYLGDRHPLAQEVGQAAGEAMDAPHDPRHAWEFGLERVVAGLAELIDRSATPDVRR